MYVILALTLLVDVRGLLQYNTICNVNKFRNIGWGLYSEIEKPQRTAAGGFSHTTDSRAKISAANKGKTPWNKGRQRTPEERARISEGVRARNRAQLLERLAAMNITEEEYLAEKKEKKRLAEVERRKRRTEKGGYIPSAETKAKISRILKEKYANGEIKRNITRVNKGMTNRTHSAETRSRISASLKERWKDSTYRDNMKNKVTRNNSNEEVRKRISETLKKKWQDPEFRQYMLGTMTNRTNAVTKHSRSHRQKISDTMKKKWQDREYRSKAINGMSNSRKPYNNNVSRDDVNRKISQTMKKKWQDKEYRALMAKNTPSRPKSSKSRKSPRPKPKPTLKKPEPPIRKEKPTPKHEVIIPHTTAKSLGIDVDEDNRRVSKLRQERRDLYDLLYGDEDDEEFGSGEELDDVAKLEDFWSVIAK